jgi:hypothetical protein
VRRWLRRGEFRAVPKVAGLWGEAADRFRRALTVREKQAADAERRLEDFLDALRASPNGVVLLDRAKPHRVVERNGGGAPGAGSGSATCSSTS